MPAAAPPVPGVRPGGLPDSASGPRCGQPPVGGAGGRACRHRGGAGDGKVHPFILACWTVLSLALVYAVHPAVSALAAAIPAWLGPPALIVLGSDALVSCAALRRTGTTDVLRWYA